MTASVSPTRTPAPATLSGGYESGTGNYIFTGTGTPGDTVVVTVNGGQVGGSATVQPDGSWSLPVSVTLNPGDVVQAHSGSASGPSTGSSSVQTGAGGPATPILGAVDPGATVLTFNGTAGETVTIVGPGGQVLGSTVVGSTGPSAIVLNTPVSTGPLSIVSNGHVDGSITVSGSAGSPPSILQGAVLTEGSTITGTGNSGYTIQVVSSDGQILGTTTVLPDGSFAVPVTGAREGTTIKVLQNGVAVDLAQTAQRLGEAKGFLSRNVFRPGKDAPLDIGFKAQGDEHVTVKIFNLPGETVRLVAEIEVRKGVLYALKWDGRNDDGQTVASGLYVISIYGPQTRILKKVVVLK